MIRTATLAERPDLASAACAIPYPPESPAFMAGNPASLLVRRRRVVSRWPHLVVVLVEDGQPVARGIVAPYSSAGRAELPAGWDEAAVWAAEDVLDGVACDTACALEIAVDPGCLGRGLSAVVLEAMRSAVRAAGLTSLLVPLRPPDKAAEPFVPMAEYAARVRADGLPADRWLRTHVRAGGRVVGVAWCSSVVQAPPERWREWTGLPFDRDGEVVVPGALAPVVVSLSRNVAVYVEPNVWVRHEVWVSRPGCPCACAAPGGR